MAFNGTIVEAAASPRINVPLRAMSALVPGSFFASVPGAIDGRETRLGGHRAGHTKG